MITTARENLIQQLQHKIHRLETISRVDDGSVVSSGCAAINQILPEDGYKRGTLIEWFTPNSHNAQSRHHSGGYGADFLSLLTAQKACADGGALVVIDPDRQFYPPAAAALGINSGNLIILRSTNALDSTHDENQNDLYWAIDQALRCPAVAAVWGPLGWIGERWFRRFQLSAESSGTLGLFVRPASALNQPSWAEVQWEFTNAECGMNSNAECGMRNAEFCSVDIPHSAFRIPHSRSLRLRLLRCRGTLTGQTIDLEINTITGSVCESTRTRRDYERQPLHQHRTSEKGPLSVAAQLAHSKTRRLTKRA